MTYITSLLFFNNDLKIQIALLFAIKVFLTILLEYSEFTDVFSSEFTAEILKYKNINNHTINLVKS